jgi:hypothetical protein
MAIAMTVGATKIQILQQTCMGQVEEGRSQEDAPSPEVTPAEQACGT